MCSVSGRELIDAYSELGEPLGAFRRSEVHELGMWHSTVHCWVVARRPGGPVLLAQRRSPRKTHPGKLDSSAGGHVLSKDGETAVVRELREELGVVVSMDELVHVGVQRVVHGQGGCDRELAHVFVLYSQKELRGWMPDSREVAALLEVPASVMAGPGSVVATELCAGRFSTKRVCISDFLPFGEEYWSALRKVVLSGS